MKRLVPVLALALAALGAPNVASAHAPDIRIAGFQYTFTVLFETGGVAGYVGVPAMPPVYVGGTASIPDGDGAQTDVDEQIGVLYNHDRVDHTFTQCTAACDTAVGSSDGALFDVALPAGAAIDFLAVEDPLPAGLYTFMCKVHPWMRGEVNISG